MIAILLALGFAAAVVAAVRELRTERSGRRRALLIALRIATAVAAVLVAVQPGFTAERFEQVDGRLALLFDGSRSMRIPIGETSRAEAARALAARLSGDDDAGRTSVLAFGSRLRPSSFDRLAEEYPSRDDETRIAGSILSLLGDEGGDELGAVVVVSDGADPRSLDRAADIARHGIKVHAVATGSETAIRDDAIAEVAADPIGFLRQPARVRVTVRSLGGGRGGIPLTLRRGEEVVRETVVSVDAHGEGTAEIQFTPDRLGRAVYRLGIPVAPDDLVPENNERAFLVRVTRDKLRVLLVAGRPSWDVRFLRAFLKRDPSIDLISFFILRTSSDLTMASPDELALIPFPTDELFREHLGSFDLVLFQNFDYGPYQMGVYLPRIRDYVERGGSFAMVGGPLAFASGGYASTPVAEILPVELPPRGTPDTVALSTERFEPQVVPELVRHPLLELLPDPAESAAAWARLSPLTGANVVEGLRPGTQTLLVHPRLRTRDGAPMPILAVGPAGQGRTLALMTDTSWHWGMTTGGRSGDASAYERFWDRALRWLARDPSLEPAQITTDRERYGPSARVEIEALLRDPRYEPLADRDARIAILDPDGAELASGTARTDGEGRARLDLTGPEEPGGYRVVALLAGATTALCEEGFVVETGGDELADPRPRPDVLRALAEATGGSFYASPDDAPELSAFDTTRARSLGTTRVAPLATPWALLVVLAFLGAEWTLRRRWGRR